MLKKLWNLSMIMKLTLTLFITSSFQQGLFGELILYTEHLASKKNYFLKYVQVRVCLFWLIEFYFILR